MLSRTFTVGRYTCVEKLGQGPTGELWRAKRFGLAGLDRQFLLYRIGAAELEKDPSAALRLQAALRSVSDIQHQNLLPIDEFGSQGGETFVAYPFVGFANLSKLKNGLDLLGDEAKAIFPQLLALLGQQLARALCAAHERGVMHGLLCPANVYVDPCGEAHIAELGLWSVLPQGAWNTDGGLKTVAPYIAKELLETGVPGPRSDVFALGRLLSEPLNFAQADKLAADSRASLLALKTVCQKSTASVASQRYANLREFITAIDAVRVGDAALVQLKRFGSLFELAGDSVPQPVTTSDRSAAEPLPPPPSMKISLGPAAATGAGKAAPPPKQPGAEKDPAADADRAQDKNPVSINPRAAFGPGFGGGASAVTPTADVDAAEAEIVKLNVEASAQVAPARKRPSNPSGGQNLKAVADEISVTETSPAIPAFGRHTPRRALPKTAEASQPVPQPAQTDAPATETTGSVGKRRSGAMATPIAEENPALDSTGSYSQPALFPSKTEPDNSASGPPAAMSQEMVSTPGPPSKRLPLAAMIGIGLSAAIVAGVVVMALVGRGPQSVAPQDAASPDATSPKPIEPKAKTGELQIDSTPVAEVFVNGESKGKTPIAVTVKPGPHKLLLLADGYKLFKQEVSGGQKLAAKLVPATLPDDIAGSAEVQVKCKHKNELRILVNGNDTGLTCPTEALKLKPGKYTIGFLSPVTDELREKTFKVKKKGGKLKTKF